ncbi:MAG: suppressor of fused domain protein [Chloroflexales bacterium]|nr:suppressor of fused domain protein [Chloroflexales bacterium]
MSIVDPYREQLSYRWEKETDPALLYYDRLLRWKGQPTSRFGARPKQGAEGIHSAISAQFSICIFQQNPLYDVFCTIGASRSPIPRSTITSGDPRGIRHEYLMHASNVYSEAVCEILLMIAEHPHIHNREIGAGYVMPIGEPIIPNSALEYLYFTYPFLDDPHIYDPNPAGEIDHPQIYIQTLWILPISPSERQFLRTNGVEAFEVFLHEQHSQRYDSDLLRRSLI